MKVTAISRHMRAVGFAAAAALLGLAGTAHAGIANTKHNLSSSGTFSINSDNPEICVFCHTPHAAIKNNSITLWNHTLTDVGITYTPYTSPTFDAGMTLTSPSADASDANTTNLCLSCHDGTVALNSLNNASNINPTTNVDQDGTVITTLPAGLDTNLGTNLSDDHPVNISYAAAGADLNTLDPLVNKVRLYDGYVQCASCHDPHAEGDPALGTGAFLRTTMNGSALCLECHNK